ncbi:hypothetical protein HDU92_008442 [Lobulomyces angularis]|nr:hypothetical protein HDU92_008442 [Lobulomyces angularis]
MLFNLATSATILLATLVNAQNAPAPVYEFKVLKDHLSSALRFPDYTAKQRVFLADQVNKMISVYVNHESKIKNYGINSRERFADILSRAANMTNADLQNELVNTANSLRDGHTGVMYPAPHSCFAVTFPVSFQLVEFNGAADPKNPIVAVSSYVSFPEAKAIYGDELKKIKLGHILVSINGLTPLQLFEKYAHRSRGANFYGGMKAVLNNFFGLRGGRLFPIQLEKDETSVTYVFKERPDSKNTYTVSFDLVSRKTIKCVADFESTGGVSNLANEPEGQVKPPKYVIDENLNFQEFTDAFNLDNVPYIFDPETKNVLGYTIYKYLGTKLGIIRLTSFTIDGQTAEFAVEKIRKLLLNELKDTDCLLWDLRSNGGGWVQLADSIPQFFKADFTPNSRRFIMSPVNNNIMKSGAEGAEATAAYFSTPPGSFYSNFYSITSKPVANFYGNVYLKPVATLNDGNCFSACETVTANLQDSGSIKKVFGTDLQTGGGGASISYHKAHFCKYDPIDFQPLPGGQDMALGYRGSVRNGVNLGTLIEDNGVRADELLRPTLSDVFNVNNRSSIFDRIAHQLRAIGQADGSFWTKFHSEPNFSADANLGVPFTFSTTSTYINKLELHLNGKVVDSKEIGLRKTEQQVDLVTPIPTQLGTEHYTIVGYTANRVVLKTERYLRYIPNASKFASLQPGASLNWDFKFEREYVALFNIAGTAAKDGWNLKDGKLVIGDGLTYGDNVTSKVSFFVTLNGGKPSITLSFDSFSEQDYDYVIVSFRPFGGEEKELLKVSGEQHINTTLELPATTGSGELSLTFASDGGSAENGGIKLNSLSLSA